MGGARETMEAVETTSSMVDDGCKTMDDMDDDDDDDYDCLIVMTDNKKSPTVELSSQSNQILDKEIHYAVCSDHYICLAQDLSIYGAYCNIHNSDKGQDTDKQALPKRDHCKTCVLIL